MSGYWVDAAAMVEAVEFPDYMVVVDVAYGIEYDLPKVSERTWTDGTVQATLVGSDLIGGSDLQVVLPGGVQIYLKSTDPLVATAEAEEEYVEGMTLEELRAAKEAEAAKVAGGSGLLPIALAVGGAVVGGPVGAVVGFGVGAAAAKG